MIKKVVNLKSSSDPIGYTEENKNKNNFQKAQNEEGKRGKYTKK